MRGPLVTCLAAVVIVGCSQVLGFKEPVFDDIAAPGSDAMPEIPDDMQSSTPIDARIDAPPDMAIDMMEPPPQCVPTDCPFGCDTATNACKEGKLWIFKTAALFVGNAFGGSDVPPNVRRGADAKCLEAYNADYQPRQCDTNRVHAILHVSDADSIASMASRFSIPPNTPVFRAEDDEPVSASWSDLTGATSTLIAPATYDSVEANGIVWTGANGTATCAGWTSRATADTGSRGYTTRTEANWLSVDTFRCDRLFRLLCVCW